MTYDLLVTIADVVSVVLILLGTLLTLIAAIGLVRFPEVLSRMHVATKPQILGLLFILFGLALRLRSLLVLGLLVLVGLFQLFTAPVAAHMVGRASYRTRLISSKHLVVDELENDLVSGRYQPEADDADDTDELNTP